MTQTYSVTEAIRNMNSKPIFLFCILKCSAYKINMIIRYMFLQRKEGKGT